MAEPSTITAAACAATVAICVPILSAIGVDATDSVFAAMGCVCLQTLLPSEGPRDAFSIVKWAVGSVLLSTALTPWVGPWLAAQVNQAADQHFRHLVAMALGAFAQPLAVWIRARFKAQLEKRAGNA